MRFVAAVMYHETNTFSPLITGLQDFDRILGSNMPAGGTTAIEAFKGTNTPFAAFIDCVEKEQGELIVPITAYANPGGIVKDQAFDHIADSICEAIRKGCDAVLLDLHGAMVTETYDDAEGELLRRIRSLDPDVPIAVALDFHANLSPAMVELSTVITAYRTYPHIDNYETGLRAVRTLLKTIKGEIYPVMYWKSLPMMPHMLRQTPSEHPMKAVMGIVLGAESKGTVLNASILGGFPLADTPYTGLSAVVVTHKGDRAGKKLLEECMGLAWDLREEFIFTGEPLGDSIQKAKTLEGPVVLVDHGDNAGAGGGQDVMAALAEVIRQRLKDVVAGPFCDPAAVQSLINAGIGSVIDIAIGGKINMPAIGLKGKPLTVRGTVTRITDGTFTITGPMGTGMQVHMGRTAVLDTGTVEIMVSEERCEPCDTGVFTHAGIDPTKKHYVLIKSRQHFRAGFEPIAKQIVLLAGPGVCSSDYNQFPFNNLRRPVYPLDPEIS